MADLASIAAATTAGYSEIVVNRGSKFNVTLEKLQPDVSGHDVVTVRSHGEGSTQVAAETQALAALNHQRDIRSRVKGGTIDQR